MFDSSRSDYYKPARIWGSRTGDPLLVLRGHDRPVWGVAWSPDGGRIATASNDRTGRIWNARTGAALHVLQGHDLTVRAEVRSADSRRIVTASDDCAALIWDTDHGTRLAGLHDHAGSTLMRTGRTMTSGLPPPPPVAPSGSGTPKPAARLISRPCGRGTLDWAAVTAILGCSPSGRESADFTE